MLVGEEIMVRGQGHFLFFLTSHMTGSGLGERIYKYRYKAFAADLIDFERPVLRVPPTLIRQRRVRHAPIP